ncbi:hypothetical protein SAMN04487954_12321 [Billgrantia gudaonensis]|uniref:Uncharacterized protein n=2 Tax=Billgrantia gudaonensis TaxID=376427 RepID=A0A1G9DV77_9GAMM|nr:hypothetical protein SAMN04487954_12321 [Halomonas gudaonensis]
MEILFHYLHFAVEIIKVVAWPLLILVLAYFLKDHIKEVLIKHNGTEFKVVTRNLKDSKKDLEKLINKMGGITSKEADELHDKMDRLYRSAMAVVKERATEVESGSNSDGSHTLYNNGQTIQEITIAAGDLLGRKSYYLPSLVKGVCSVTFVGQETPRLVHVDPSRIEVELDQVNECEIKLIVSGVV